MCLAGPAFVLPSVCVPEADVPAIQPRIQETATVAHANKDASARTGKTISASGPFRQTRDALERRWMNGPRREKNTGLGEFLRAYRKLGQDIGGRNAFAHVDVDEGHGGEKVVGNAGGKRIDVFSWLA